MVTLSGAHTFAERVFSDFGEKNVAFMAAGLAYNAFVSLVPMLILLFLLLSAFGAGIEERLVELAEQWLPGPIANVVVELLGGGVPTGGASIIGLIVLVWGTFKIFRGLDTAFSEIYETEANNSITDKLRDAVVVFTALVVALIAMLAAGAVFAVFSDVIPYLGVVTPLALVAGLVVAFFPVYYVFPDTDLEVREVLPGVVFAAVGWAVFQALFQVYLSFSEPGSGSFFGGVVVVITYLYFSSLVLLLGAVINAVVGAHSTGRPGGVGRGATSFETERDDSMNRDELAAYLQGLREQVAGHYEEMRPANDGERRAAGQRDGGRPRPDGDVSVTEHSSVEDGRHRWTVTLQWDVGANSDEESGDE
ncbi:YihY/virulence factor BrkB family protein [Halobacterium zhouii]|uniref:YihY/virulence factor BrkB family protein n=1 Tax=Halobacterium zhouii TaxID=2902624 RepID=UPI001E3F66D5|nr:YihY/virulence factor BrkB family protein [Halobacterium zhouii]